MTTNSQRVAKAHAKLQEAGGKRLYGWLQPDAAQALDALMAARYAPTLVGCISQALLDAQRKVNRKG